MIQQFGLQKILPARVADYLQHGITGQVPETIKMNDPCLNKTHNVIVASIRQALAAAQKKSAQLGYVTKTVSDKLQGEARDAARLLAQNARAERDAMQDGERHCLLYGSETIVTVHGTGIGGRNQEIALAFALEIDGDQGISLLSAGTDGTDGPNDAAGAIIDGDTAARAQNMGIDPRSHLNDNDSYTFFQHFDTATGAQSHLKTGPTGTNVMDIQIVLLDKKDHAGTGPD